MATATNTVTKQTVDFSNVKDGGATFNKKRVPGGDYLAKITKVQDAPAKDGIHQWLYTVELVDKYTDRKFPYYCKLQDNQLWKLRNLFIAGGIQVPKKKVSVDPSKIVNRLIGITLEDDEYDGKPQSVISSVFAASELVENDAEDEADDLDDAEDEDEDTAVADDEDDEEEEEEPAPAPRKAAAKKPVPAQRSAKKAAPVDDVDDEELEALDLDDI